MKEMFEIVKAEKEDIPEIVNLLNITYRSEESFKGWTSEAHLIQGPIRTDAALIEELMQQEGSMMLKCIDGQNRLIGCVHLRNDQGRLYLGMLSVLPNLQGGGIGKRFLKAADQQAKKMNCRSVYMQVVSGRKELTDWYIRHGFRFTGEKKDFDVDAKYGVPSQKLEFHYMEKLLD